MITHSDIPTILHMIEYALGAAAVILMLLGFVLYRTLARKASLGARPTEYKLRWKD